MRQGIRAGMASEAPGRVAFGAALMVLVGLVIGVSFLGSPASPASAGDPAPRSLSPAKKKALAKCKQIKKASARKTCASQVNQRFLAPKLVDVRDDYFFPNELEIRSGRRISWDWGTTNGNSHNVMLDPYAPQPKGITPADYFRLDTGQNHSIDYRFTRDLTKIGEYNFYCSLHSTVMRMKVKVTR